MWNLVLLTGLIVSIVTGVGPWWVLLFSLGLIVSSRHYEYQRQQKQRQERLLYEAALPQLIARRQRQIARDDAAMGLASAPMAAANAATLDHLANPHQVTRTTLERLERDNRYYWERGQDGLIYQRPLPPRKGRR